MNLSALVGFIDSVKLWTEYWMLGCAEKLEFMKSIFSSLFRTLLISLADTTSKMIAAVAVLLLITLATIPALQFSSTSVTSRTNLSPAVAQPRRHSHRQANNHSRRRFHFATNRQPSGSALTVSSIECDWSDAIDGGYLITCPNGDPGGFRMSRSNDIVNRVGLGGKIKKMEVSRAPICY